MASVGYLETLLSSLPAALRPPLVTVIREGFGTLQFGTPRSTVQSATNFHGNLVPFTTAAVGGDEVAVAHGLGRVPRLLFGVVPLDTVNAALVPVTITRVADATYLYVSSTVTGASAWVYAE